jgi:hypothetical protein
MSTRLDCCYIGEKSGIECGNDAEWEIWHGNDIDDYTLSCARHVGQMLDGCAGA